MGARVAFIHGRPGPHPFHAALARAVRADFVPVDFLLRWHDRPSSRLRRYLSWLLCALLFPQRGGYDIFLAEGPHFLPVIMKRLRFLRPRQRIVSLLDNETLYFLKSRRYPASTHRAVVQALRDYDALICVGQMQTELAEEIIWDRHPGPRIVSTPSAVSAERSASLAQVVPSLDEKQLLFVGNGPSGWRGWYKGVDLLLAAAGQAASRVDGLRLLLVGDWDDQYVGALLSGLPHRAPDLKLMGHVADLRSPLSESALYVHLGRGEAFGISVLEAMSAGLPALVSEWTGAREAVEQVDPRLVVPLDADQAAERICWYMELSSEQRRALSTRCRAVAGRHSEERALAEFVERFRWLLAEFALPDLSPLPLGHDAH